MIAIVKLYNSTLSLNLLKEKLDTVLKSFSQSQGETTSNNTNFVTAQTGGALPKKSDAAVDASQTDTVSMAMQAHKQGEELANQERWNEAVVVYRRSIDLNPNFSWSHHNLGKALFELEDWQGSAEAQRKAIALNSDFVWSHYGLGLALAKLKRWDEALNAYRQAKALDSDIEAIAHSIVEALQALIQQNPREVALYQALAEERVSLGKFEEAIASYQMALQIDPFNQLIAITLAQLLAPNDPTYAQTLLERARGSQNTLKAITTAVQLRDHKQVKAVLKATNLFDVQYYVARYQLDNIDDALEHYLTVGHELRYNPNPLFDTTYYLNQNPDIVELGINALAHYYVFGRSQNRVPHPFFSHKIYLERNSDVNASNICPLEHYLAYGAKEGRSAFSADQFPHLLQEPTPTNANYLDCFQAPLVQRRTPIELSQQSVTCKTFGVYCNSLGNYFITEIADYISAALESIGHRSVRLSELDQPPESIDHHVIVAPHEVFYLGEGVQRMADTDWWSKTIMVNVEQPQTTWFSKAFHFLRRSRLILDINVKSAAMLQELGLQAHWFPLGYLENYQPFVGTEALPNLLALKGLRRRIRQSRPSIDAPLAERPIDLHFVGTLNERRNTFFAKNASWLNKYRCFWHIPPMGTPLLQGQGQALDTDAVIGLSRRSKILLNLHRDELPYFEWHRIMFHGLWQNTLVVTEPCHDVPGLLPNIHYVACSFSEMPQKIQWLLDDLEGQQEAERIRSAGHLTIKTIFHAKQIMKNIVRLVS